MTKREDRLLQVNRLGGALVKILLASIYVWGLSRLIVDLVGLPVDPVRHGLVILLTMLILASLTWQRYSLLVFSGLWFVFLMYAIINRDQLRLSLVDEARKISNWITLAIERLIYNSENPLLDPSALAIVICVLLAVIFYLTLARFNWPGLAVVTLLIVVFFHYEQITGGLIWAAPSAIIVIAAIARDQIHTYRELRWARYPAQAHFMLAALPIAAVSLVLAIGISLVFPATAWHSPRLFLRMENLGYDISQKLGLNQTGEDEEGWFSIASHGFYPQVTRLGGPAILSDDPVMYVSGYTEGMLLRGSTSSIYDGFRWRREPDATLYPYLDPQFSWQRDTAFDKTRPFYDKYRMYQRKLARPIRYSIQPAGPSLNNLFLAGRPLQFNLADQSERLYYNLDSLLIMKPPLTAEESVTVRSVVLLDQHPDFADLTIEIDIDTRNQNNYFDYTRIQEHYLQIPDLPEYDDDGAVAGLARDLSRGAGNEWATAMAIKQYLTDNFRYNLNVQVPPADTEFVSWFLQSGEGYCVYFATAMTMLCRSADIPARYAEGYAVSSADDEDDSRLVTGRQAHAWTEVYLNGMGWVAVDSTPGGSDAAQAVTPTPFQIVTVSPGRKPLTPIDDPPISETPSIGPTPTPGVSITDFLKALSPKWLYLLILIPLLYAVVSVQRYWRWQDPAWLAKRYPDRRRLIIHYWQDIKDILHRLRFNQRPDETPRVFLERALIQTGWFYSRQISARSMLNGVEKALYSPFEPDADELDAAYSLHIMMEDHLRENKNRFLFLMRQICYHRQKRDWEKRHANH